MKLIDLTFNRAPSIKGLRINALTTITPGEGAWADWRIAVRGPRVYLMSPPGWTLGSAARAGSAVHTFDIPREDVTLHWEGEDVDKTREWGPGGQAAKGKQTKTEAA